MFSFREPPLSAEKDRTALGRVGNVILVPPEACDMRIRKRADTLPVEHRDTAEMWSVRRCWEDATLLVAGL